MNKRGAYLKKALNIDSVRARHSLLIDAIKSPQYPIETLSKCVENQRAFAALSKKEIDISPISLNTLKKIANELFSDQRAEHESGFAYLDSLRIELRSRIERTRLNRSNDVAVRRGTDRNEALLSKLHGTERQLINRTKAYLDIFSKINKLLTEPILDEKSRLRLANLLDAHQAIYWKLFAPDSEHGQDCGTVVPMPRHPDGQP
jgi:hypothetical protein